MLIKFSGGKVYDPLNGVNGEIRDLFISNGRIIEKPADGVRIDKTYEVSDRVVMAVSNRVIVLRRGAVVIELQEAELGADSIARQANAEVIS